MIARTCGEARDLGLKRYFSGKACPKGHLSDRYTSTQSCIQCATEKQKDYIQSRGGYRKRHFIPDDELYQEAKKYNNRSDFQKNSLSHYSASHKRGILNDVCAHMTASATGRKWFLCTLIKEINKYDNLSDFNRFSSGAAYFALRCGLHPIVKNKLRTDAAGDYDVFYLMAFDYKEKSKRLYKAGVTSLRLGEQRIKQNIRSSPFVGRALFMFKTDNATKIENSIIKTHDRYTFNETFSGSTEYFLASDEELTRIYEGIIQDA